MKIRYLVEITDPETHVVKVKLKGRRDLSQNNLSFFLPSWSPGSYLMREYSRNIINIRALGSKGELLNLSQVSKNEWNLSFTDGELEESSLDFCLDYSVYCHELTVRTSHVDYSHAFLHGPSYLMGIKNADIEDPEIEFRFPGLWSKLHTALKDISDKREVFLYEARDYDELIDTPVEIGCHESDGFMVNKKEHHIAIYGDEYPHRENIKKDIKEIVEYISNYMGEIPYEQYLFIIHFVPNLYGGLEHLNSTALQFDGRLLGNRKHYLNWLSLVSHEYFHTWNVKRIRPIELGPFDYQNENYTRLHWLTEGLTSFMDELFILRAGLCTIDEYLELQRQNLDRYFKTPGKKFQSLEDSSFNTWIKLYRPDENSHNANISYYLKGALVLSTLHFELLKEQSNIDELIKKLWHRYNQDPGVGVTHEEVMSLIEEISNQRVRDNFEARLKTCEDIDFEGYYKEIGCEFIFDQKDGVDFGMNLEFKGDQIFIKSIILDSTSYKAGVNAGDELLAINRLRVLREDTLKFDQMFKPGKVYTFTIARKSKVFNVDIQAATCPRELKQIKIIDYKKVQKAFL